MPKPQIQEGRRTSGRINTKRVHPDGLQSAEKRESENFEKSRDRRAEGAGGGSHPTDREVRRAGFDVPSETTGANEREVKLSQHRKENATNLKFYFQRNSPPKRKRNKHFLRSAAIERLCRRLLCLARNVKNFS